MREGSCQVGVDPVGRKVFCAPRQAAKQDLPLVEVAGATAASVVVSGCKLNQGQHGTAFWGSAPASQEGFYPISVRSSIGYRRILELALWLADRRWKIVRGAYLAALTGAVYLNHVSDALVLIALGQFAEAGQEWRRGRAAQTDRHRPTEGAFLTKE
jgi:hypothetical protein